MTDPITTPAEALESAARLADDVATDLDDMIARRIASAIRAISAQIAPPADVAGLVKRLRVKGQQDREMPNHYVHRMEVERIEAADALEAQAREIAALTAKLEAAEAKVGRLVEIGWMAARYENRDAYFTERATASWYEQLVAALREIGGGNG